MYLINGEIADVPVTAFVDYGAVREVVFSTKLFRRRPSRLKIMEAFENVKLVKMNRKKIIAKLMLLSVKFNGVKKLTEVMVSNLNVDAIVNAAAIEKFGIDPIEMLLAGETCLNPPSLKLLAMGRTIEIDNLREKAMSLSPHVTNVLFNLATMLLGPTVKMSPKPLRLLAMDKWVMSMGDLIVQVDN